MLNEFGRESIQTIEDAEGLQTDRGQFAVGGQGLESLDYFSVGRFAAEEFLVDAVALGSVGRVEGSDELGGGEFSEVADGSQLFANRNDAIDAAFVVAGADIEFGQAVRGNPAGMLDDEAVHINDPEGAVRAGAGLDGTKPIVARGEE